MVNDRNPSELLEEMDQLLKKKKQARYFAIAGFCLLLAHAVTDVAILVVLAIVLLVVAIVRNVQVKLLATRVARHDDPAIAESGPVDGGAGSATGFAASNAQPRVSFPIANNRYTLSFLHEKENWEGDDILLCESNDKKVKLHPATFFKYLQSTDCSYLHTKDKSLVESLETSPCLKFGYLEDSRDYPSIRIDGVETCVMCKYLCPVFHIFNTGDRGTLVVAELRDEDGKEIPALIVKLEEDLFSESTAEFSAEENAWVRLCNG